MHNLNRVGPGTTRFDEQWLIKHSVGIAIRRKPFDGDHEGGQALIESPAVRHTDRIKTGSTAIILCLPALTQVALPHL